MPPVRVVLSGLLAAAAVAAVGDPAALTAQPPAKLDLPTRPSTFADIANVYKTAGTNTNGIPKADLPKARATFDATAKFYADTVSHPRVHTFAQEFTTLPPPLGSPPTIDQLIVEINRMLLVPSPVPVYYPNSGILYSTTTNRFDADYIREMGAAFDKALGEVIAKHPERVVRVNAARMLAAACKSGAHAHYPTVTGLISDKGTDPEIKYYALHAAANLLSAYDINDPKTRKHSNDPAAVGALVAALQDAVTKQDAFLKLAPVEVAKGDVRQVLPPDMVAPHLFIRRQAVKALAQCRYAEFEVEKGKKLYPAHTLALVAVSAVPVDSFELKGDKLEPVKLTPGPADTIEAVLGICNMSPPPGQKAVREKYAAAMADVVATGVVTWATLKKSNPADKSLPWKGTALRLADALTTWKGVFDPLYFPGQTADAKVAPAVVYQLSDAVMLNVATPLGGSGDLQPTRLEEFRANTLRQNKDFSLAPFPDPGAPTLPKR
jgi:hypothetical protein